MYANAIEKCSKFTRPIQSIIRSFGENKIVPGAATLFFVNAEGYSITCKHVIELLVQAEKINKKYLDYKAEVGKIKKDGKYAKSLKGLQIKYHFERGTTIQIKNRFLNCVDKISGFTWHLHPSYDLAILKFNGFTNLSPKEYAVFKKDTSNIKQGSFLCRLGYPFPEFTNFKYNETSDDIEWTDEGIKNAPSFPIEGMVTRFLGDSNKNIYGLELSTPGLRGQSGGPLFDHNGIIHGMQSRTKSLYLGFDIEEKEIIIKGRIKKVSDYSFIHLGECIHVNIIKAFLKEHNVNFKEEEE